MSSPEPPVGHAPDLITPVIGFRQWRMEGGGLLSIAFDETWRGANVVARCLAGGHPREAAPVSDCSCGIHAWYEQCPRTGSASSDYVAGAVVLWGAIELHATGMRAQYCRIVALALPLSRWGKRGRVLEVAGLLGVPAVRHRDLTSIAAQHGIPISGALRPPPTWPRTCQGPYARL